jgi:mRNA interferase MazF
VGLVSGGARRFDVFLAALDPTSGAEMKKTRPALIVSPDEMNRYLRTVVAAPLSRVKRSWPTRVTIVFDGKEGQVTLDQIRTLDQSRLIRRLGRLGPDDCARVTDVLLRMFAAE